MGNSESATVKKINPNAPLKSALKRTTVVSPTNGYKYYPTPYPPEQYFYPPYPTHNPVDSNQNQFHSQSPAKNTIPQQQIPRHYDNQDMNSSYHKHHHHHHRHHHHHHRSQASSEKENFNLPIHEERSITPHPPRKPVSSVVTYQIASSVVNRELPASPQPVHHSTSMLVKKNSSPNSMENPLSPAVVKQHQTSQPIISKTTHPPLLAPANHFEKAPPLGRNYISKSPDNHSLHNYSAGPLTIVRKSPLRHATSGNRWYDHDYDKRVNSLTTNDV